MTRDSYSFLVYKNKAEMFLNAGLIYDIHLESSSAGLWEYPTRCSQSPALELSKCRTLGISYMMFPKSGTRGSGATVPQCHSAAVPGAGVPEVPGAGLWEHPREIHFGSNEKNENTFSFFQCEETSLV